MVAPYTTRLVGTQLLEVGNHELVTIQSSDRWIIRDVVIYNQSGVESRVSLYIDAGGPAYSLVAVDALAPGAGVHWEGRQVIRLDERLMLQIEQQPFSVLITAYQLTST